MADKPNYALRAFFTAASIILLTPAAPKIIELASNPSSVILPAGVALGLGLSYACSKFYKPVKERLSLFIDGGKELTKRHPMVSAAYLNSAKRFEEQGNVPGLAFALLGACYADSGNKKARAKLDALMTTEGKLVDFCALKMSPNPEWHLQQFIASGDGYGVFAEGGLANSDGPVDTYLLKHYPHRCRLLPAPPQPEIPPANSSFNDDVGFAHGHRVWRKARDKQAQRNGTPSPTTIYAGDGSSPPPKQEIIPRTNESFETMQFEKEAKGTGTPNPNAPKTVYRVKIDGNKITY